VTLFAGLNPRRSDMAAALLAADPDARLATIIGDNEIWESAQFGSCETIRLYPCADGGLFVRMPHRRTRHEAQ